LHHHFHNRGGFFEHERASLGRQTPQHNISAVERTGCY
jgi:hypothetical protein